MTTGAKYFNDLRVSDSLGRHPDTSVSCMRQSGIGPAMPDTEWDTSPEGILNLVAAGEGRHVEFKEGLPPVDSLRRYINAFANADGGVLLVGVADNGDVKGILPDEGKVALGSINAIAQSSPGLKFRTGVTYVDGKAVAYIAVGQAPPGLRPLGTAAGKGAGNENVRASSLAEALKSTPLPPVEDIAGLVLEELVKVGKDEHVGRTSPPSSLAGRPSKLGRQPRAPFTKPSPGFNPAT